MTQSVVRNIGSITLKKSSHAVQSVGSFFGVTNSGGELQEWKEKFSSRAKNKQIGFQPFSFTICRSPMKDALQHFEEIQRYISISIHESKIRLTQMGLACTEMQSSLVNVQSSERIPFTHPGIEDSEKYHPNSNITTANVTFSQENPPCANYQNGNVSITFEIPMESNENNCGMERSVDMQGSIRHMEDKEEVYQQMETCQRLLHKAVVILEDNLESRSPLGWRKTSVALRKLKKCTKDTLFGEGPKGILLSKSSMQHVFNEFCIWRVTVPWFVLMMSLFQMFMFAHTVYHHGFAPVGLTPKLHSMSHARTFLGLESVVHWKIPNIWIGPDYQHFISYGAVYAPCMREDIGTNVVLMQQQANFSEWTKLGCCELNRMMLAGTTTEQECHQLTAGGGSWQNDVLCSARLPFVHNLPHVIRPCCHGQQGKCIMASHGHCVFLEGRYFSNGPEHCSQVNCLHKICQKPFQRASDEDTSHDLVLSQNQWWRALVSLFLHYGIVHLLLVVLIQMFVGKHIEASVGSVRIALVYIPAGVIGLMAGTTFSPSLPHIGATGSCAAILCLAIMETVQSWKSIDRPGLELIKLALILSLLVTCGTLPIIDNITIFVSVISGGLLGIIVLPHVTFGRWDIWRRRCLCLIAVPLLTGIVLFVLVCFHYVQNVNDLCGRLCEVVNCVFYTENMCDMSLLS